MGKGGGGVKIPNSPSDVAQAQILQDIESSVGKPVRAAVMTNALPVLAGSDVFNTSLPASDRGAIENQFTQAKKNLLASGSRGGLLRSQMSDLNRDRAATVSQATNAAKQLGTERALGLLPTAFPSAASQMSARSASAQNEGSRLAANAQMKAQASQAKGSNVGTGVGMLGSLFGAMGMF